MKLKHIKKKNFKGDSLVEVIVAFAIVSIVGIVMVAGVVTAGKIQTNTTWIKNAGLNADEDLQNKKAADDPNVPFTIYKIKGQDENGNNYDLKETAANGNLIHTEFSDDKDKKKFDYDKLKKTIASTLLLNPESHIV